MGRKWAAVVEPVDDEFGHEIVQLRRAVQPERLGHCDAHHFLLVAQPSHLRCAIISQREQRTAFYCSVLLSIWISTQLVLKSRHVYKLVALNVRTTRMLNSSHSGGCGRPASAEAGSAHW